MVDHVTLPSKSHQHTPTGGVVVDPDQPCAGATTNGSARTPAGLHNSSRRNDVRSGRIDSAGFVTVENSLDAINFVRREFSHVGSSPPAPKHKNKRDSASDPQHGWSEPEGGGVCGLFSNEGLVSITMKPA
jgi:hypothetical protein